MVLKVIEEVYMCNKSKSKYLTWKDWGCLSFFFFVVVCVCVVVVLYFFTSID